MCSCLSIAGGELLDVVSSDEQYAQLSEPFLWQIWRKIVSAVEWMHTCFVVHRDIKLESTSIPPFGGKLNDIFVRRIDVLLKANSFTSLPPEGKPIVQLTNFGLARKINPGTNGSAHTAAGSPMQQLSCQ
jgi:serine/threonine protein kinase